MTTIEDPYMFVTSVNESVSKQTFFLSEKHNPPIRPPSYASAYCSMCISWCVNVCVCVQWTELLIWAGKQQLQGTFTPRVNSK